MKTERVTLLTTPEFKRFLGAEAKRENVSVAELVRSRCERRPSDDEAVLIALADELRAAVGQARRSLHDGLAEADAALAALRAGRADPPAATRPRKSLRKAAG